MVDHWSEYSDDFISPECGKAFREFNGTRLGQSAHEWNMAKRGFEAAWKLQQPYRDELMKIATDLGEPNDPFAAWERLHARPPSQPGREEVALLSVVERLQINWDNHREDIGAPMMQRIARLQSCEAIMFSGIERDLIVYALAQSRLALTKEAETGADGRATEQTP